MILLTLFALFAGFVTVLSPCILPVLPIILSASAGQGKARPFGVILGLIISFVFFTLALTQLVHFFGFSANLLRYVAIVIIGLFGLVMLFPALSNRFAAWTSWIADYGSQLQTTSAEGKKSGFLSGLLLGSALGLVWTPCAGPILAAITTLVATQKVTFEVILLTIAYSIGAGIPLLFIAYGGNRALTSIPFLAKHTEGIRHLFGGIMVLTAIALALNWDVLFQQKVLDYLPNINIENNVWVQNQLSHLRSKPSNAFAINQAEKKKAGEPLPVLANAPPLTGIVEWVNTPPLTLEQLRGKVVLIDFWTYSCINCIRTFPYLRDWYSKYKDKDFVIIGVHTPEFEFEKDLSNVENATKRFELHYPIALDNNYKTWEAFNNSYWPAHYLIDKEGSIRDVHFGEGAYLETENAIRSLLNLAPLERKKVEMIMAVGMTPETYLGYKRARSYSSSIKIIEDQSSNYHTKEKLEPDQIGLEGKWIISPENITSDSDDALLELDFMANRVYLVLGGKSDIPIHVELDGKPLPKEYWTADMDEEGSIRVKEARKYDIVNLKGEKGRHILSLKIPKGVQAYAFTFGMEE